MGNSDKYFLISTICFHQFSYSSWNRFMKITSMLFYWFLFHWLFQKFFKIRSVDGSFSIFFILNWNHYKIDSSEMLHGLHPLCICYLLRSHYVHYLWSVFWNLKKTLDIYIRKVTRLYQNRLLSSSY